ncbi:MAG: helical backbone metal receptor [Bacteroidota bacterium]
MKTFIDQTGRTVTINDSPQRIISIVPSQTELLFDLGLTDEVIGITKFCVHPDQWFRNKKRVGGTKKLNLDLIRTLQPDLIIANKEENEQLQVEELIREFPVWVSDIKSLPEAKRMILSVGDITNRYFEAIALLKKIDLAFDELRLSINDRKPKKLAYLIWNEPMMAAAGDTFISRMIDASGFNNVFQNLQRYPEITDAELKAAQPDVILLSSEPFPFKQKHLDDFIKRFPGIKSMLVDGELFSWYGSRLQYAPAYFMKLLEQIETVK